jgi:DNA helicase-2/ATP-dependent DNA helicase PcrA
MMFDGLNPAQSDAVSTLSGPLLVLAGAGTGKTRVVTYRIANLIRHGTRAQRILAVTFTKKAAGEMQQRAAALLGKKRDQAPEISTFHSLCLRVLRRHIARLGYPAQFAIYDRGDQDGVARGALREIRVPGEVLKPGDLLYYISRWKTSGLRPAEAETAARTDKEHLAAVGYRRYQAALVAAGAVDFDDLLLLTEELFAKFADVRRNEAARFDHVLIDEYQDTNAAQYQIVRALSAAHRNLCVVGDDDQSIYAWRGAEVTHILRFKLDWPEAKVVRLEENYRSTSEILAVANRLIAFNKHRHEKVLRASRQGGERPRVLQFPDETAEADEVVADIQRRLGDPRIQPRDLAILVRTNEQPRLFETALRRAKVPYVLIGGLSFYDRKEVKDILAYLRLLVAPHDEVAALRVINKPPRGVGESAVAVLMQRAVTSGRKLWEILGEAKQTPGLSPAAVEGVTQFRQTIDAFRARLSHSSLADVVGDLVHKIDYRAELARQYKDESDQESRWGAVEELINAVAEYQGRASEPSLAGFLDDVLLATRDEDDKESQLGRNAVALMTLHSAKGLEFPEVYLVGMEEGILPHRRSIEAEGDAIDEERRLCYVGVTRAQDRLTLTLSLSRNKWGKPRDSDPSRFLFELTGQAENPQEAVRKALARRRQKAAAGTAKRGAKRASNRLQ